MHEIHAPGVQSKIATSEHRLSQNRASPYFYSALTTYLDLDGLTFPAPSSSSKPLPTKIESSAHGTNDLISGGNFRNEPDVALG